MGRRGPDRRRRDPARWVPEGRQELARPPSRGGREQGRAALGFATCGGTVLDLELEDNLPRIQQRLFMLADECSETFHLCVSAPSLADGLLDEIAAFVVAHPGTRLVIVDTLQTVRQSSQKSAYASDYRDVRAFKGLADHFGIAVVLVHHQRKMDDPDPPQHRLGDERHHRRR